MEMINPRDKVLGRHRDREMMLPVRQISTKDPEAVTQKSYKRTELLMGQKPSLAYPTILLNPVTLLSDIELNYFK